MERCVRVCVADEQKESAKEKRSCEPSQMNENKKQPRTAQSLLRPCASPKMVPSVQRRQLRVDRLPLQTRLLLLAFFPLSAPSVPFQCCDSNVPFFSPSFASIPPPS